MKLLLKSVYFERVKTNLPRGIFLVASKDELLSRKGAKNKTPPFELKKLLQTENPIRIG